MKEIYLVRHAQSKSQTGEDSDCLNPELSDLGRRQAQRLAKRLDGIEFDRVCLSPLRRAWQTFQFAQISAPKIEFDSRAIEIYGGYQTILPLDLPDFAQPDRHDAWLDTGRDRAASLMGELVDAPEQRILVIAHAGILSTLFKAFARMDLFHHLMDTSNTGVSLLVVDENYAPDEEYSRLVRYWNDHAHVADLLE